VACHRLSASNNVGHCVLRAKCVSKVEDVEPAWLVWRRGGGLEEGLKDGVVGCHMVE
jgi:hypothetical protein